MPKKRREVTLEREEFRTVWYMDDGDVLRGNEEASR